MYYFDLSYDENVMLTPYIDEFHIVNISVERERSMMEDTLLDILIKE